MFCFLIIFYVGCITFYYVLPETEGRSLLEIEAHLANKSVRVNE